MKTLRQLPPNIDQIQRHFDINPRVIFTYGDTIYNPGGGKIDPSLMVHEEVHMLQQGDDPQGWWDKYVTDVQFRLDQEVEAYRTQYKFYLENYCMKNGKVRRSRLSKFIRRVAGDLSSSIYGGIVTYDQAVELITGE